MLIRETRPGDLAAITAIYADAVTRGTGSFETEPPDETEMARRFAALAAGRHPYLVAESDGRVVGYAYAGPYRVRPAYRHTVENSVYVDARRRRGGIGRQLLDVLVGAASERGFRQMVAVIGDSDNRASIALHEACGFTLVGTLQAAGWKHGRWLDTVLMQRSLGPGDGAPGLL